MIKMHFIFFITPNKEGYGNLRLKLTSCNKVYYAVYKDVNIHKSWWNEKDHRLAETYIPAKERKRINDRMEEVKDAVRVGYNEHVDKSWLQNMVDNKVDNSFYGIYDEYVKTADVSDGVKDALVYNKKSLQRFEKINGIPMSFDITSEIMERIEDFFLNEHKYYEEHPLLWEREPRQKGQNATNTHMKLVKRFFIYCKKKKYTTNDLWNEYKPKKDKVLEPLPLKLEEVVRIYKAVMPPDLERIRDQFCLHCNLGCRVSDLMKFKKNQVQVENGQPHLVYIATKTYKEADEPKIIKVPLNYMALSIIEKYQNPNSDLLFPCVSTGYYNIKIKEVLKAANIHRSVFKLNALTNQSEWVDICDVVSSHTARKTFITAYANKFSASVAAQFTDHKEWSRELTKYVHIWDSTKVAKANELFDDFKKIDEMLDKEKEKNTQKKEKQKYLIIEMKSK